MPTQRGTNRRSRGVDFIVVRKNRERNFEISWSEGVHQQGYINIAISRSAIIDRHFAQNLGDVLAKRP